MYFDALVGGSLCFVGMKEMLHHIDSYHSEAMQVASIAKKIQHEMFDHDGFMFSGNVHVPPGKIVSQNCSFTLISMVLL